MTVEIVSINSNALSLGVLDITQKTKLSLLSVDNTLKILSVCYLWIDLLQMNYSKIISQIYNYSKIVIVK